MAHDSFGNAANQGPRDAAPTMAADHDKVGLPFLRCLDDLRSGRSVGYETECVGVSLQVSAEIRHQTCRILLGRDNKVVRGDPRLGVEDLRWIDDIDQGDLGTKGARQIHANIGGASRDRIFVDGNKYLLDAHPAL